MSEQELDCAQIAGAPVDQHRLRSARRVGAELGRIEPNAGDPFMDEPSILFGRQSVCTITAAREQELPGCTSGRSQIVIDCQIWSVSSNRTGRPVFLWRIGLTQSGHRTAAPVLTAGLQKPSFTVACPDIDRTIENVHYRGQTRSRMRVPRPRQTLVHLRVQGEIESAPF
jgi:hypothetical protein